MFEKIKARIAEVMLSVATVLMFAQIILPGLFDFVFDFITLAMFAYVVKKRND